MKILKIKVVLTAALISTLWITSGCGTVAGLVIGEAVKVNYKKTHKQCPYCKSWMELDATVCPECGRDYSKDKESIEGEKGSVKK